MSAIMLGLCRQTIYAHIRKLNEAGHRIEGCPYHGFMARMLPQPHTKETFNGQGQMAA